MEEGILEQRGVETFGDLLLRHQTTVNGVENSKSGINQLGNGRVATFGTRK